jgi:hypothetical protein
VCIIMQEVFDFADANGEEGEREKGSVCIIMQEVFDFADANGEEGEWQEVFGLSMQGRITM